MSDERENLSWQRFGEASRELATVIAADGFEPDLILSIARGGLFLAGSLGYALAVKNLYVMNVEFYDGVGTTLDMPVMLPPVPSAVDFSAKKVLIADDVADTGRTIELVHTFIKDQVDHVRTAVIYEKSQSVIKCDYVWRRTDSGSTSRGALRTPSSSGPARSSTPNPPPTPRQPLPHPPGPPGTGSMAHWAC
jgi:hypoxanthine phosphoribosyltransferase